MLPNAFSFDRLFSGTELAPGLLLMSKNQAYFAKISSLGCFQIYVSNHFVNDNLIYTNPKINKAKTFQAPFRLFLSLDGDLQILDKKEELMWSSETKGKGKPPFQAILQNDGNFVIFDSGGNALFCVGMIDR